MMSFSFLLTKLTSYVLVCLGILMGALVAMVGIWVWVSLVEFPFSTGVEKAIGVAVGVFLVAIGVAGMALGVEKILRLSRPIDADHVTPRPALIPSKERSRIKESWPVTIGYNVMMVYAVIGVARGDHPFWVYPVIGLFCLIGLFILVGSKWTTLEWLRFGRVVFMMDSSPAHLGGGVSGNVRAPPAMQMGQLVTATLQCRGITYTPGADGTSRREEEIWKRNKRTCVVSKGKRIPIEFEIPPDLPESDLPGRFGTTARIQYDRQYHDWELIIHAAVPGIDLNRSYEILVQQAPARHVRPSSSPDRGSREPEPQDSRTRTRELIFLAVVVAAVSVVSIFAQDRDLGYVAVSWSVLLIWRICFRR